ncbi:MAG TPA: septum formation protein Maf [Anaerolineae bacterium]|nr:septum formation protein Maf [Anaerolineae bacterium]
MSTESEATTFILASASPRRKDLLKLTGWGAIMCPVEVDELPQHDETAEELVKRLALTKVRTAAMDHDTSSILLAADTVVVDGRRLLGKPSDGVEAREMLWDLRGRRHRVLTTLALLDQRTNLEVLETCEPSVPMREYTMDEVDAYITSGGPMDKAGGYGIQDTFSPVAMEDFRGCYANVMGLPLCHLVRAMRRLGQFPSIHVPEACQANLGYDCFIHREILGDQV